MWCMCCIFSCLAWDQSLGGTLTQGTPVSRFSNMVGYCWNHCLDFHDWSQSQLKSILTGSMKGSVTQLPVFSCAQFNTGTLSRYGMCKVSYGIVSQVWKLVSQWNLNCLTSWQTCTLENVNGHSRVAGRYIILVDVPWWLGSQLSELNYLICLTSW